MTEKLRLSFANILILCENIFFKKQAYLMSDIINEFSRLIQIRICESRQGCKTGTDLVFVTLLV